MSFSVASRMTIIWYGIIAYRQPEISDTGIRLYLDFRVSLENELKKREERTIAGLSSGFVNAKRKDPRYLSGRLSLFCQSASGYSPHVVLGQEVRLRSGRNLSRGATLSSSLSQSSSPLASISFHPGSGWRAKGFRPADEANEFGSGRCTLFGAKGSVGGK